MNARQKAKKYKRLAEKNAAKAAAYDRQMLADAFRRANDPIRKYNIQPYRVCYMQSKEGLNYMPMEYIKGSMLEELKKFLSENMKINQTDLGFAIRYEATIYIGFENGGGDYEENKK